MNHSEHMAGHSSRMVDTWRIIQLSRHLIDSSRELTHPPPRSNLIKFPRATLSFEEWLDEVGHMINSNEVTPFVRECLREAKRMIEAAEESQDEIEQG